jgi:hypothetical protein
LGRAGSIRGFVLNGVEMARHSEQKLRARMLLKLRYNSRKPPPISPSFAFLVRLHEVRGKPAKDQRIAF